MASYWKSPYKETTYNSDFSHPGQPQQVFTSPKATSLGNLKGGQQSTQDSPQGWIDWANSLTTKSSLYHMSRPKGSASKIRGILKVPNETESAETGRASQGSDSRASTTSKKKRVTFGVLDGNQEDGAASGWSGFQTDRSILAHQNRLTNSRPLDELAKETLKRLLGYVPGSPALPPVSGKGMMTKSKKDESSLSLKCRHNSDLRCAKCMHDKSVTTNAGENESNEPSNPQSDALRETTESYPELELKDNKYDENPDLCRSPPEGTLEVDTAPQTYHGRNKGGEEPRKEVNGHWTKSFFRPEGSNKTLRYSDIIRRYPHSAGSLRKRLSGRASQADSRPAVHALYNDFTKLHINGDGKIMGIKANGVSTQDDSALIKRCTTGNGKRNSHSHGSALPASRYGFKIQATPTHIFGKDVSDGEIQIPKSAPSRIKFTNRQSFKDIPATENDARMSPCLDKTSQILSWLKDVQQKRNYQPRHARLYALEPQQLH